MSATLAMNSTVSELDIVHMASSPLGHSVAIARRVHMLALDLRRDAADHADTDLGIARQLDGNVDQKRFAVAGWIGRAASFTAASSESESEIGIVQNPKFLRLLKTASF